MCLKRNHVNMSRASIKELQSLALFGWDRQHGHAPNGELLNMPSHAEVRPPHRSLIASKHALVVTNVLLLFCLTRGLSDSANHDMDNTSGRCRLVYLQLRQRNPMHAAYKILSIRPSAKKALVWNCSAYSRRQHHNPSLEEQTTPFLDERIYSKICASIAKTSI